MSDVRKEKFAEVWNPISEAIVKEVNSECLFHPAHLTMSKDTFLDHKFNVIDNKLNRIDTDGIYDKLVKTRIDVDNLIRQLTAFKGITIRNLNDWRSFDIFLTFTNAELHDTAVINYRLIVKNGFIVLIEEHCRYMYSGNGDKYLSDPNETVFSMLSQRQLVSETV